MPLPGSQTCCFGPPLTTPGMGSFAVSGLPSRSGCRARISPLLAICATEITSPEGRRELTQCWDRILHEGRVLEEHIRDTAVTVMVNG